MARLDVALVEQGFAASRTSAQGMIAAGRVQVDGKPANKPSQNVVSGQDIVVAPDAADRFVSRGGLKLAGALEQCALSVAGLQVLDVGISTGGFSDCLLQGDARRVIGVEVGHDQLHPRLRNEPRLVQFEGVNARHLTPETIASAQDGPLDLVVGDVSFISLTLVLPALRAVLPQGGRLLFLVKPQFEVGPEHLGKGGIVKNEALYPQVAAKVCAAATQAGFSVLDYFPSLIAGGDGNREFFIYAHAV